MKFYARSMLINATYNNPAAWKMSNATPISKSTGNGTPSGYRTISLLSIL